MEFVQKNISEDKTILFFESDSSARWVGAYHGSPHGYKSFVVLKKKTVVWVCVLSALMVMSSVALGLASMPFEPQAVQAQQSEAAPQIRVNAYEGVSPLKNISPELTFVESSTEEVAVEHVIVSHMPDKKAKIAAKTSKARKTLKQAKRGQKARRPKKQSAKSKKTPLADLDTVAQGHVQDCKRWVSKGEVQKGVVACEKAFKLNKNAQAKQFLDEAESQAKTFYIQGYALESIAPQQSKTFFTRALLYAPSQSQWKRKSIEGLRRLK